MTSEEAVARLNALDGEPESSHSKADDILLRVLRENNLGDVANAWIKAHDRVGFWYA